ncbi:HAMP domain-containing histidine kinase [Patescibacteria group bacterium]|nr:HAMP domain-containing histidine kinase [Patescibacteria group bacterium]
MSLLPFEFSLTVGAAFAVFVLGFLAWWHNKWARGNLLFALMAFSLSLWTTVDWVRSLQGTALSVQISFWRLVFYLTVAFGPALAIHASTVFSRQVFRIKSWIVYAISLGFFGVIDTAFLLRSVYPETSAGSRLLEYSALFGVVYYLAAILIVMMHLYPVVHSQILKYLERRRAFYGLLLLALFLSAGLWQLVQVPVPTGLALTVLCLAFFLVAAMGFIRTRLFDVDFFALEAFCIVLVSSALIVVMRTQDFLEFIFAFLGAVAIGGFGFMAIGAVHQESKKRRTLETVASELRQLDKDKTDFVSIVTHQLRGPLTGTRFAAEMLLRGDYGELSDEAREIIGQIKRSNDRLLELTETSLNAARIEAGAFHSVKVPTDVTSELRLLLAELGPFAKSKDIELTSSFTGVPPCLKIDREVLRNVVFNLIDNALKYTDHGKVNLAVTLHGRVLSVAVSDTGRGLTEEEIKNLFKRFHRGRNDGKHYHNGTGLGLYVVKKMITAIGGQVDVNSDGIDRGSVFTIQIPIE